MTNASERAFYITPILRGLLSNRTRRVALSFEEKGKRSDCVIPALPDGDDTDKIISFLKANMPEKIGEAITIDGLGTWQITEPARKGRLEGFIAVVTGGAQGFGAGISKELAREGAVIVVADINQDGAVSFAAELESEFGAGSAAGLSCDVGNEDSVAEMLRQAVMKHGGVDLMVSNAGIVRAGSVKDLSAADFALVTRVNYEAFFLCAKHSARIMSLTHKANPEITADIIQVNSKSGLAGSNRNGAYAGSKFGGIGLVQSFALELLEDGIKVNAICPGNYFDGPLWSDPEKGLFAQYAQSGKVPGAKTVADVKEFYESKIPMHRGCLPSDVAKAIFYAIAQDYETGQAIPVTGGQVMLN